MTATPTAINTPTVSRTQTHNPIEYSLFILVSFVDVLVSWQITRTGGQISNFIAQKAMDIGGFPGLLTFKLFFIILTLTLCEMVSVRKPQTGKRLSRICVLLVLVPVLYALCSHLVFLWHNQVAASMYLSWNF